MKDCDSLSLKRKRRRVWKGEDCKGLDKDKLTKNKRGTIVSKSKHKQATEMYEEMDVHGPKGWMMACRQASSMLGHWPVPIKKNTEFYKVAKKIFEESKSSYIEYKPLPSAYSPFVPVKKNSPKPKSPKKTASKFASPVKRLEDASPAPKASVSKSGPAKKNIKKIVITGGYSPFKP